MSVADLTKEQKQYIILGIIVSIALIVLTVFGVKISLSSITVARAELDAVSKQVEDAEKTLKRREQVSQQFAVSINKLKENITKATPLKNYYSWATEIIYSHARSSELEIDAVDELDLVGRRKKEGEEGVALESYSLRISAQGSYASITKFLESLEKSQQLLRITGVDIRTGRLPENHIVQIFVQWPANIGILESLWQKIENQKAIIRQREQSARSIPNSSVEIPAETISAQDESMLKSTAKAQQS